MLGCRVGIISQIYVPDELVWFDFSDATTMFTNSTGTTPVTANGDIVRYVRNKGKSSTYLYNNSPGGIYTTNGINGLNSIYMDISSHALLYANNTLTFDPTKGITMIIILKPSTNHMYHPFDVSSGNLLLSYINNGVFEQSKEILGLIYIKSDIPEHPVVGRNELYMVIADPNTTTKIYRGSTANLIYSDTYYIPPSGNYIIKPIIGTYTLGEILVYDQVLSDSTSPTLDSIVSSLRTKWNITY